jgi:hypothetical protein
LRDIEVCLRSLQEKLYHLSIRGRMSRTTLADANEKRDWRMYTDFCQILISKVRVLDVKEDFGVELADTAYALDSTTIGKRPGLDREERIGWEEIGRILTGKTRSAPLYLSRRNPLRGLRSQI